MDVERTEAIRHEGNLQNLVKRYRIFLDTKVENANGKITKDITSKIIYFLL